MPGLGRGGPWLVILAGCNAKRTLRARDQGRAGRSGPPGGYSENKRLYTCGVQAA